jgi:hypothetical protein
MEMEMTSRKYLQAQTKRLQTLIERAKTNSRYAEKAMEFGSAGAARDKAAWDAVAASLQPEVDRMTADLANMKSGADVVRLR